MVKNLILDGNHAAAIAMKQINPEVVAAYPITPTTYVMEAFSEYVANGEVDTELILVESEHSAMSACVGAAAAGGRVMTATSSQGLALMHEVLFNASGMRLPIVLINGNRALSAPLSIHGDHSDAMAARDTGWIQLYAKNPQEVYDLTLMAIRISEHEDVRTPVMVNMDAFQVTHMATNVEIADKDKVAEFLGEYKSINPLLDTDKPVAYGNFDKPPYYFEHRRAQHEGLEQAKRVILEIGKEFEEKFGRSYSQNYETYNLKADTLFIMLGSNAESVRHAISEEGVTAGVLRLKVFRPFPADIKKLLKDKKRLIVMDRTMPSGAIGGPLYNEIRSAFYGVCNPPKIENVIYGIGQREFNTKDVKDIFEEEEEGVRFWGVKGDVEGEGGIIKD